MNQPTAWARRATTLLMAAYLVLAVAFSVVVPVYEAPDEPGHVDLIVHLVNTKTLPAQNVERRNYAHHPPLYYVLAAIPASLADVNDVGAMPRLKPDFAWPGKDGPAVASHNTAETFPYTGKVLAIHLARLVSVLCGALTVALTIAIGWAAFPGSKTVGLLAASLVAFNPQFLFTSGTVNNDSLAIAACAGALWQLTRAVERPDRLREWALVGVWAAAAALSKSSTLVVIGVAFIAWLACAARTRSASLSVRSAAVMVLVFSALAGWWFLRNQALYGDPLGWEIYKQAWAVALRTLPLTLDEVPSLLDTQFRSAWGVFGWMNVYADAWLYAVARLILAAGILGWLTATWRRRAWPVSGAQNIMLLLFVGFFILQEAFIGYQNTIHNASHAQGRYLFPTLPSLMLLAGYGIVSLLPARRAALTLGALVCALAAIPIIVLSSVIAPAYRVIPLPKLTLLSIPRRGEFVFGDMLALKGYAWDATNRADAQTRISVRLYWQASAKPDFNYSVFVHALDASGQVLAQQDQSPGAQAGYLPAAWRIGDIVADTWVIDMPQDAWDRVRSLRVGAYNHQSGQRLPEKSGADFVLLDLGR